MSSAWNGLQAVEAIKAESFDVALMDVQMPEMDGLEATRQIRAWEGAKKHLPIVILTGSVPTEISDTYKIAGADTFIAKPFDIKRLELLINIMASEEPNASQTISIYDMDRELSELAVLDEDDALSRFDDDVDMFHDNLSEFIKGIPARLERLNESITSGQWQDVSLQAHNLKGVSANYGAKVLSVLAYRLDEYSHAQRSIEALNVFNEIEQHLPVITEAANNVITKK